MMRKWFSYAPGLLFSLVCGGVAGFVAAALKVQTPIAVVVAVLTAAVVLYVYFFIQSKKEKLKAALFSTVTEPILYICEASVHFLTKSFQSPYRLFVCQNELVFIAPDAPASLQKISFLREAVSFTSVLISPPEEEPQIYDWLMYENSIETAEIHTKSKVREALKAALQDAGYLDNKPPVLAKEKTLS